MKYTISINGCDDSTCFDVELDDKEAAAVHRIALLAKETSTYVCMPTMEIEPCIDSANDQAQRPAE